MTGTQIAAGGTDPLAELADLVKVAREDAAEVTATSTAGNVVTVGFFDLSGSTAAKLTQGTQAASGLALTFTMLARGITTAFGGKLLKTLGDGAMAVFDDPVSACRAALNLRQATHELLMQRMTAGLTSGRPMRVDLEAEQYDLLGDVVDRAARVQTLAAPGQVLIDSALHTIVRGEIAGRADWTVNAAPRRAYAKGIGDIELFELTITSEWPLKKQLATPFMIMPGGRPDLSQKLALLRNAQREVIEIGTGLTNFAQYFTGQKPDEFRDPIRELVRGGVDLNCYALDLAYEPGLAWVAEQANAEYVTECGIAKGRIERESKFCRDNSYLGSVSYRTYRRIPQFWCLGVDVDDPVDGRMFFASYLMGVARSANPVVQVSRTSNPDLFAKFLACVAEVRAHSA